MKTILILLTFVATAQGQGILGPQAPSGPRLQAPYGSGGYGTGSNPNSVYVQPRGGGPGYYRTMPNGTTLDNYSTRGNTNSHNGTVGHRTGTEGTIAPYR